MKPKKKELPKKRAIFIDRDGTINVDHGYTYRIEDFHFLPKAIEGLKMLAKLDYKLIIITNQSGIGRGLYTHKQFEEVTQHMLKELTQHHLHIDKVYHCPHHPDEKCTCRKPEIGMLKQAEKDFNLDLRHCFMIGDLDKDIEAGKRAGCKTILIKNKEYAVTTTPDVTVTTIVEAAEWIKKQRG